MSLISKRSRPGQSLQYGATTLKVALAKAALHRGQLPPGELRELDVLEPSNRAVLIHEAAQHGPIFKVTAYGNLWVCIVGLEHGRRFIKAVGDGVRPVTMDLEPLFPGGFMRQMTGEFHRTYRRHLGNALARLDLSTLASQLEPIVSAHLRAYFDLQTVRSPTPGDYKSAMHDLVTDVMLQMLFGASPGTKFHAALVDEYARLGGTGLAWTPGDEQAVAFRQIRELLTKHLADTSQTTGAESAGLISLIAAADHLDDTMLGNLIYMAEMGRDDVTVLFRWLTKYGTEMPQFLDRIAVQHAKKPLDARPLARAFVSEALRTDQSYRLLRITTQNITFDGFFIPKNSMIRVCMWESHRSTEVFDDPFDFDPTRFVESDYNALEFSPFGIDHHQCPFASASYVLSEVFLSGLACNYRVRAVRDGQPHRGPYHWEPSDDFVVDLEERS